MRLIIISFGFLALFSSSAFADNFTTWVKEFHAKQGTPVQKGDVDQFRRSVVKSLFEGCLSAKLGVSDVKNLPTLGDFRLRPNRKVDMLVGALIEGGSAFASLAVTVKMEASVFLPWVGTLGDIDNQSVKDFTNEMDGYIQKIGESEFYDLDFQWDGTIAVGPRQSMEATNTGSVGLAAHKGGRVRNLWSEPLRFMFVKNLLLQEATFPQISFSDCPRVVIPNSDTGKLEIRDVGYDPYGL